MNEDIVEAVQNLKAENTRLKKENTELKAANRLLSSVLKATEEELSRRPHVPWRPDGAYFGAVEIPR